HRRARHPPPRRPAHPRLLDGRGGRAPEREVAKGPEPVTGWTSDELTVLAGAGSIRLTAGHEPGPEVELGMVLVSDELYVRAYRGPQSRWFQAAQESGRGRIR